MAALDDKLARIRERGELGYWGERVWYQIAYATRLSRIGQGQYDELLDAVADGLLAAQTTQGTITKDVAQAVEDEMRELSADAKRFQLVAAAHAHIDMNWMWRWDETVAVTLDTFRTMLGLLRDYPDFRFSQSQASTYRIVEEYAPQLLPEIRSRVQEGRWEVTASTWVEADKNLPNGESLARHLVYTKRYLGQLLGLDPKALTIDFEPDTFGHSVNVPEILASGGVKYYYHCRGYDGHHLYRWVAPSGASILAYREPIWYNAAIGPEMALHVPDFCAQYQMETMLKVYGVGDHGGGPTRRDIERILDMSTWPVFPTLRMGTFGEYFRAMESMAERLPEVRGELNFVFTGCYTTQTRIKQANRVAEATLHEAEMFRAASALVIPAAHPEPSLEPAWRNVLFNQFHDILPGSGVAGTREYALGLFQETLASATTAKTMALRRIAEAVDTSAWLPAAMEVSEGRETVSEGAGVGFGVEAFNIPQTDRGRGKTRIFHVFNAAPVARREAVQAVVWDWPGDTRRIEVQDGQGRITGHQVLDQGTHQYWGHRYLRLLIQADVPACGYATYILAEAPARELAVALPSDLRVEREPEFVLENRWVRVALDSRSGAIASLVDRETGQELVPPGQLAGVFRLIQEDPSQGMTAWRVGRYMKVQDLLDTVRLRKLPGSGRLRTAVGMEMDFAHSKLKVTISLDVDSPRLRYDVECDWREFGSPSQGIPQLAFHVPTAYSGGHFVYDVPFGVIERPAMAMDVPANRFAMAINPNPQDPSWMVGSDCKHGFRGEDHGLSLTLIRSAFDPDPYPEIGKHTFRIFLEPVHGSDHRDLVLRSVVANHPLNVVSASPSAGVLPLAQSFFGIEGGSVALSAVKLPEDGGGRRWIVRLYETDGHRTEAVLRFGRPVAKAYWLDLNERPADGGDIVNDGRGGIAFGVDPCKIVSVGVEFA